MGIFHSTTPCGTFPFLGATKLHIYLKASQYFLGVFYGLIIIFAKVHQTTKNPIILPNN